jgi:hypothetical protein
MFAEVLPLFILKLNINIPRPQCILLNKLPPWLDLIAHQHGEDAVGFDSVVDLDAYDTAGYFSTT